jgi:CheY-like chemotaxis protein
VEDVRIASSSRNITAIPMWPPRSRSSRNGRQLADRLKTLATAADLEEAFWQASTAESRAILRRGGQERCSRRLDRVHSVDPGGLVDVGRDHLQAGQDEKGITLPLVRPVPLVALLASEVLGRISWALDQGADALIAKPVTASALAADACGDDKPTLVMPCRSG